MAYSPATSAYPTRSMYNAGLNVSPVEHADADDAVIARQNHAWKYRRAVVLNLDCSRLTGTLTTPELGLVSTSAWGSPFYRIGGGAVGAAGNLWSCYDHDTTLTLGVAVRLTVAGAGAGNGEALIRVIDSAGAQNVTFIVARPSTIQWHTSTLTINSGEAALGIEIYLRVSLAGVTVTLSNVFIWHAAQGNLGV